MRVESRLNRQGMYSPSLAPAGNEGALTAWAEAMTEEWTDTGYTSSWQSGKVGWA